MVGRELSNVFNYVKSSSSEDNEVLRVENLGLKDEFSDISFSLYKGEVLGITGLMGAGRTEIMRALFGLDHYDSGRIFLDGELVRIKNTEDAIKRGIAYVSEDRRSEGILPNMSIRKNTTIVFLKELLNQFLISRQEDIRITEEQIQNLNIRTPHTEQDIKYLSGGNQQKVCLAKWLIGEPRILILDEPTKGIDIGAKAEIHKIINELTNAGVSVILVSSELPEIIGAADRILVLYQGKIVDEFDNHHYATSQEEIVAAASGL